MTGDQSGLHYALDGGIEVRGLHRFGDIIVHTGRQTALAIPLHGVGSHGDDGQVSPAGFLLFANGGRSREAIHDGHLYVHQYDIEGLAGQRVDGFLTIRGDHHSVSPSLQQAQCQCLVDEVILRQLDVAMMG